MEQIFNFLRALLDYQQGSRTCWVRQEGTLADQEATFAVLVRPNMTVDDLRVAIAEGAVARGWSKPAVHVIFQSNSDGSMNPDAPLRNSAFIRQYLQFNSDVRPIFFSVYAAIPQAIVVRGNSRNGGSRNISSFGSANYFDTFQGPTAA